MKNVLFATTALVAVGFAGSAFAEVTLSGNAEIGITFNDVSVDAPGVSIDDPGVSIDDDETEFANDIDVTFTLTGATETGLTFGASIDLDEADGTSVIESSNSVFISGDFGQVSMGDVDGAYDQALANVAGAGLEDEGDSASGTSGLDGVADGEILRYDYSFGAFTASASLELEEGVADEIYGFGVSYQGEFGGASVGLGAGYQFTETSDPGVFGDGDHNAFGVSAVVGIGALEITAVYEFLDRPSDFGGGFVASEGDPLGSAFSGNVIGVGGVYDLGAIDLALSYQFAEVALGVDGGGSSIDGDIDLIQGHMTYDLTGGAEFVAAFGYANIDGDGGFDADVVQAGAGIGLSF